MRPDPRTSVVAAMLMATAATVTWATAQQPARPVVAVTFTLSEPLPKPPETMTVYEFLPPEVSEVDMRRWTRAFGLGGQIVDRGRNLVVTDGERSLEAFKAPGTGHVRFSDNAWLGAEQAAEGLPSEAEARAKATTFLRQHGLLPENASFSRAHYSEFQRIDAKGVVTAEGRSAISVVFGFLVDGFPVIGPGAEAGVAFGSQGRIIGAATIWRRIRPHRRTTIIAPEEALERLELHWPSGKTRGQATIQTTVRIGEVAVAYYARPGSLPQRRLEPVYVFRGTQEVEGQIGGKRLRERERFEIVIPALPDGETRPMSSWGLPAEESGDRVAPGGDDQSRAERTNSPPIP